jgi:2-polyprenyl-3-methyl-5-hydroxy-6-metoxy-1,4-benzoquinol methylase
VDTALYDELQRVERTHWWFRARRQIVWSLVERYLTVPKSQRLDVCELGCGTGGNLVVAAAKHDVVGFECSQQALTHARRELGDRVRWGKLPDEIDAPAASFDVMLLTDVLEHVEQDAESAVAALRLLRPGGIVVATVPAYQWLYSPRDAQHHHVRRYDKRQFAKLWNSADAEPLLLSHYNTLLFAPAAVVRILSKAVGSVERAGDLKVPPRGFNSILARIMGAEAELLGRVPMPFGLSLVAVARKRYATGTAKRIAA